MKITLTDKPKGPTKTMDDIPVGTVFSGYVGTTHWKDDERLVFLKIYNKIVDLSDPSNVWVALEGTRIYDYKEYDAELTLKEKDHDFIFGVRACWENNDEDN